MDVSPVIASPWGRLFQFIVSSLSGCARGFGRTSCTWSSSERKWLSSLFSVLVVSCELTVPDMLMLVNPSHVTRSFSSISQSFSLTHIQLAEGFHLRWRKVYVQMWFNRSALLLQGGWGELWSCWQICFGTQIIDSASGFSKGARSLVIVSPAALHSNSGIELCTWWEMNNSPTQRNAEILPYSGAKKCQECEDFMLPLHRQ